MRIMLFILIFSQIAINAVGQDFNPKDILQEYVNYRKKMPPITMNFFQTIKNDMKMAGRESLNGESIRYVKGISHVDGLKYNRRAWLWGNVQSRNQFIEEKFALLTAYAWNGKNWYQYSGNKLIIYKDAAKSPYRDQVDKMRGIASEGFIFGYVDEMSSENIIRRMMNSTKLSAENDMIGLQRCIHVSAKTSYGIHQVWLDPNRGYNILQARVERGPGDTESDNVKLPADASREYTVSNVTLERVGGYWIPAAATRTLRRNYGKGNFTNTIMEHKTIKMDIIKESDNERLFEPYYVTAESKVFYCDYEKIGSREPSIIPINDVKSSRRTGPEARNQKSNINP